MVKFQQWNSIKPSIHIAKRSPILLELERKLSWSVGSSTFRRSSARRWLYH